MQQRQIVWELNDSGHQQTLNGSTQASNPTELKTALEAGAAQAVSLLKQSIGDDSLYLIFGWQRAQQQLEIVVTDASKRRDSSPRVALKLIGDLSFAGSERELAEQMHFLLKDFLASYSAFFNYSLVALFHTGDRQQSSLL